VWIGNETVVPKGKRRWIVTMGLVYDTAWATHHKGRVSRLLTVRYGPTARVSALGQVGWSVCSWSGVSSLYLAEGLPSCGHQQCRRPERLLCSGTRCPWDRCIPRAGMTEIIVSHWPSWAQRGDQAGRVQE
jgi:hypothetical protein